MPPSGIFKPKSRGKGEVDSSLPLRYIMGLSHTEGDIGLEIEVEGNKFPKHPYRDRPPVDAHLIPSEWLYVRDGSLRGQDNAEYVFRKPLKFDEVEPAINNLWQMFADYGTILDESNRTSVHVHLNAQEWHLNRLTSFVGLYLSVEELLTAWCGDHRVGNLFCLRAKDAPAIVSRFKDFVKSDCCDGINDGLHYAGMNFSALQKFGSVEIRSLRGVTDPNTINTWVKILERLYHLSGNYKDPREICEGFSGYGAIAYLQRVLGEYANPLLQGINYQTNEVVDSLYAGIRLAQDVCYCRDWQQFKEGQVQIDPFKRPEFSFEEPYLTSVAAPSFLASWQEYQEMIVDLSEPEF